MSTYRAKERLHTAAESYYNDEQYSDFTIICEGREYKVHRCFVAPHSKFFEKAFSGMLRETQQRKIDLKEDDPSMVEVMIKFFYTFNYTFPLQTETSSLGLHARVYTIADKYEVLGLKAIALQNFKNGLLVSYQDGQAMVEATHAVTEINPPPTCDTTLHDLVVKAWLHGGEHLFADVGKAEVLSLFMGVPWLAAPLAALLLEHFEESSLHLSCKNGCEEHMPVSTWQVMNGQPMRCILCHPWIDTPKFKTIKLSHVEVEPLWEEGEHDW